MRAITIAVAIALALPAVAQAQNAPCTRGTSKIKMSGIDFDEMRCELALVSQQREAAMSAAARNQAAVLMGQSDLAAATDRATATKAWLDEAWKEMEYWRAFAGHAPEAAKPE